MGISLTEQTAAKLLKTFKTIQNNPLHLPGSQGIPQQTGWTVDFLRVTGQADETTYTARISIMRAGDRLWQESDRDVYLTGCNGEALTTDDYYLGLRYGDYGNAPLYVCVAGVSAVLTIDRLGDDVSVIEPFHLRIPYAAGISSETFTGIPSVSSNSGGTLTKDRQTIGGVKIFAADIIANSGIQWFNHDRAFPFVGSAYTLKAKIDVGGLGGAWLFKRWGDDVSDDNWVEFHLWPSDGDSPTQFGVRDNYSGNGTQLVLWDSASTQKEGLTGTDITGNQFYGGIIHTKGSPYYIDFPEHGIVGIGTPPTDNFRLHNANGIFGYFDDTGTFFALGGSHASDHQAGGSDPIKLDDLAAPDDNTDLNASTSAHGLLKKLDNDSSHFLNGQGNWATPSASVSTPLDLVVQDASLTSLQTPLIVTHNTTDGGSHGVGYSVGIDFQHTGSATYNRESIRSEICESPTIRSKFVVEANTVDAFSVGGVAANQFDVTSLAGPIRSYSTVIINNQSANTGTITAAGNSAARTYTLPNATGTVALTSDIQVTLTGTETLSNKTLTTPNIASFSAATHSHQDAAGGGTLSASAIGSGTLPVARGGTGVASILSFSAYRNANYSLAANAWTKVPIDTERFDVGSCFDSSTNYRFTPTVAGIYTIAGMYYSNDCVSNTLYAIGVYKNGSLSVLGNIEQITATITAKGFLVNGLVSMNGSGDYIEMFAYNGHATNTLTLVGGSNNNSFSAAWVGPAA